MPKPFNLSRRALLAGGAVAAVAAALPALAVEEGALLSVDIPDTFAGNTDAPVTIIEYRSPTCGYCAQFMEETHPRLKADYLDTGKARLAVRPFVRNAMDAVVFLVAEVAGPERAPLVVEHFMRNQARWINVEDRRKAMEEVAGEVGITPMLFEVGMLNQTLLNKLNRMRKQAIEVFGIQGTPAVFINGSLIAGAADFDAISAHISAAANQSNGTLPGHVRFAREVTREENAMASPQMQKCIEDCHACYRTCVSMAMGYCLEVGGEHARKAHITQMMGCAEMCRSAAYLMLIESDHHAYVCAECAEICDQCAKDCKQLSGLEACVEACEKCAASCREMAIPMGT